jgi:hypothetical protein
MEEYVVISKTKLQERIKELGKYKLKTSNEDKRGFTDEVWNDLIKDTQNQTEFKVLNDVFLSSKDLKPILENAYFEGECWGIGSDACINKQEYINNLKL